MSGISRELDICLVTETFPPEINGVAMTLGRLVTALASRHRVTVVRPRQEADEQGVACIGHDRWSEVLRPGFLIARAGFRFGFPSGRFFRKAWTQRRPDVVHIATEGPLGWSAMRMAEKMGLVISTSFHTNFHDYSRYYGIGVLHGMVSRYLLRFHNRAARTLVPSRDLLANLEQQGYRNLAMFGRGVDTVLFNPRRRDQSLRQRWGANEHSLVLLHVGRVAPEKNIPLAFEAYQRILKHRPDARLVVVGDGPLRAGFSESQERVHFTGSLIGEALARAYASADLFIFPSLSETFGNVALEAMASGLPAVAFDYAAPNRYIRHAWNGWLSPYGDAVSFLAMAESAATSARTLRLFGERARTSAMEVPWEAVFRQFEGELSAAVDEHHGIRELKAPCLELHGTFIR
jgi:glycosyltransferase involved in cell wall biosynthesis